MQRIAIRSVVVAALFLAGKVCAQTVIWDSGSGMWNDANWNGGLDALTTMGSRKGTSGGHDVYVNAGTVTYDQNAHGDFTFQVNNGPASLNISGGATVTMDEETCCREGQWTRWDATRLSLDGGTFQRTLTTGMGSVSGGLMTVASWLSIDDQEINIDITNGGLLQNDGILLVGFEDEIGANVTVDITIDNGDLDLTGGENVPIGDLLWKNDLVMTTLDPAATLVDGVTPANFDASINFTGPGSITVDEGGIANPHKDEFNQWQNITTLITYEDLWDRGLLKADGLSGLDGETFSDYFDVTGSSGLADYTLRSLLAGDVFQADFDKDGDVDGDDFLLWQVGFGGGITSGATKMDGDYDNDGDVDGDDFLGWQVEFASPNGPSFEADFDEDGDVDGDDFLLWQVGFGNGITSGATKMDGDWDNDGDVDGDDFLGWQAEFPSPGGGNGSGAVPEPASAALACLAAFAAACLRRRCF